jgi:hypothetical protein
MTTAMRRVMRAIVLCRTAALGGHVRQYSCGHQEISYNSCRNRHCPKCGSLAKARWLLARRDELLPVSYFHVVFTVPEELAPLALRNKHLVYSILFHAASTTLLRIAADPRHLGAHIGFFAVLHTWGQTLLHHPHLHCVVPGGGLSLDRRRFIPPRVRKSGKPFFLPVRVLSALFRGLFLDALQRAFSRGALRFPGRLRDLEHPDTFAGLIARCRRHNWVVYAKPPFGGPEHVLEYLGRYTHRIAISNHRLVSLDDGKVTFRYKDYRHQAAPRAMTLPAHEFIRRFLLHVLPDGFVRIRHYGYLANRNRGAALDLCRQILGMDPISRSARAIPWHELLLQITGVDPLRCPRCRTGRLVLVGQLPALTNLGRPPPARA